MKSPVLNNALWAAGGVVLGLLILGFIAAIIDNANAPSFTPPPQTSQTSQVEAIEPSWDPYDLVKDSDDLEDNRTAFETATKKLVDDRACSVHDFMEIGGWLKSTNHPLEPIYYTYCGGMTLSNKIYLDASSGRIFR